MGVDSLRKKDPMKHHGIRFTAPEWAKIEAKAAKTGVSASDVVRHAVASFLEGKKK